VTKAHGLYHRLGIDAMNIARPASLIIARDRKVEYIYRGDSQTDRAPFNQVMEAVRKLSVSG
jgi:peroxiredoxin